MPLPRPPPCAFSRAPFWLSVALRGLGGFLGPTVGLFDCIFGLGRFLGASADAARTISGSLLQCSGFYVEGSRVPGPLRVPGSLRRSRGPRVPGPPGGPGSPRDPGSQGPGSLGPGVPQGPVGPWVPGPGRPPDRWSLDPRSPSARPMYYYKPVGVRRWADAGD